MADKKGSTDQQGYRLLTSENEDILEPALQKIYGYWSGLKADRQAPEPSEFDLLQVPSVLTNCGILEVIDGGKDFKIKFLGQEYTLQAGRDPSGKLLSSVSSDAYTETSLEILRMVTDTKSPVVNGIRTPSIELNGVKQMQSIALPLMQEGQVTELVFALIKPEENDFGDD